MRYHVAAAALVCMLALFIISAESAVSVESQHYIFICTYLAVGAVAAYYRLWLGASTMLSVAIVRWMVSQKIGGIPFSLASTVFVGLLAWLVLRPTTGGRHA